MMCPEVNKRNRLQEFIFSRDGGSQRGQTVFKYYLSIAAF